MANGQQIAEENFKAFINWIKETSKDTLRSFVFRDFLNRQKIATACGFSKSALRQNPRIANALEEFELELRAEGFLTPINNQTTMLKPQSSAQTSKDKVNAYIKWEKKQKQSDFNKYIINKKLVKTQVAIDSGLDIGCLHSHPVIRKLLGQLILDLQAKELITNSCDKAEKDENTILNWVSELKEPQFKEYARGSLLDKRKIANACNLSINDIRKNKEIMSILNALEVKLRNSNVLPQSNITEKQKNARITAYSKFICNALLMPIEYKMSLETSYSFNKHLRDIISNIEDSLIYNTPIDITLNKSINHFKSKYCHYSNTICIDLLKSFDCLALQELNKN